MNKMKLNSKTLTLLKNFSTINNSLYVKPGNTISTVSKGKNVFALARVDETFTVPFAIYELNKFIAALSLFTEPTLDFTEEYVAIYSNDKQRMKFYYCDPSFILSPEEDKVEKLKTVPLDFTFNITSDMLQSLQKASAVLKLNSLKIEGDGEKIFLKVIQDKNLTRDDFTIDVGETEQRFSIMLNMENVKLLPGDYIVSVSKKFLKFTNTDVDYWIAAEEHGR